MTQDRTIGIVGGGQLARMMAAAATGLGLRLRLLSEGPGTSAAQVIGDTVVGDYTDPATLRAFAASCDAITFDHEHVPTAILHELEAAGVAVRPGPDALVHAQDKAVMRARLSALGVPCPSWRVVATPAELVAFAEQTGWPVVAKLSRGGYDGKGVWKIDSDADAHVPFDALAGPLGPTERQADAAASDSLGSGHERPVIVAEEYVPFVRELSALVVRRPGGQAVAYPVSESVQRDGICHETTTPAPGLDPEHAERIQRTALAIAEELGVVGVLAVELMERPDGEAVVNELAMRPHNTGHWSIDGAVTSQFENHLRAVADLPLGDTGLRAPYVVMSNVLGGTRDDLVGALGVVLAEDPTLRVQLYGKSVLPGRKVAHVTSYGSDLDAVARAARSASDYLEGRRDD